MSKTLSAAKPRCDDKIRPEIFQNYYEKMLARYGASHEDWTNMTRDEKIDSLKAQRRRQGIKLPGTGVE